MVFVGRQEQIPDMQLCVKLMRTDIVGGKRFGKAYGFSHIGTDEKLFVFESH